MKRLLIFLLIITLLLIIVLSYKIQIDACRDFVKYCNEKYGEGNWTVVTDYNPKINPLGPIYRCVPKNTKKCRHLAFPTSLFFVGLHNKRR